MSARTKVIIGVVVSLFIVGFVLLYIYRKSIFGAAEDVADTAATVKDEGTASGGGLTTSIEEVSGALSTVQPSETSPYVSGYVETYKYKETYPSAEINEAITFTVKYTVPDDPLLKSAVNSWIVKIYDDTGEVIAEEENIPTGNPGEEKEVNLNLKDVDNYNILSHKDNPFDIFIFYKSNFDRGGIYDAVTLSADPVTWIDTDKPPDISSTISVKLDSSIDYEQIFKSASEDGKIPKIYETVVFKLGKSAGNFTGTININTDDVPTVMFISYDGKVRSGPFIKVTSEDGDSIVFLDTNGNPVEPFGEKFFKVTKSPVSDNIAGMFFTTDETTSQRSYIVLDPSGSIDLVDEETVVSDGTLLNNSALRLHDGDDTDTVLVPPGKMVNGEFVLQEQQSTEESPVLPTQPPTVAPPVLPPPVLPPPVLPPPVLPPPVLPTQPPTVAPPVLPSLPSLPPRPGLPVLPTLPSTVPRPVLPTQPGITNIIAQITAKQNKIKEIDEQIKSAEDFIKNYGSNSKYKMQVLMKRASLVPLNSEKNLLNLQLNELRKSIRMQIPSF
jgi:hypothetical protein